MNAPITVSPSYRLSMFSIFDKKMGRFAEPFCAPNEQVAKRSLIDFLRSPSAQLYTAHPEDFECVEVGYFDTASGLVVKVEAYQGAWFRFEDLVSKAVSDNKE